jgi:GT2 family glycosyltransferase
MTREAASPDLTVVICTRDRPAQLQRTITALQSDSHADVGITIVDQSEASDPILAEMAARDPTIAVVRDRGRGAARARNLGWRRANAEWVLFVDDDCVPQPGWLEKLRAALARRPEASLVTGHVDETPVCEAEDLPQAAFPLHEERLRSGRWTHPCALGYSVFTAIRRAVLDRLGGFDERLGHGAPDFPAGEDSDFNYRLLRMGGIAYLTPQIRALHDQRRNREDLLPLYRGRVAGWSGFALKHIRSGDRVGGAWLWCRGAVEVARMLGSALRRRSRLRFRIAMQMIRGLIEGTYRGMAVTW